MKNIEHDKIKSDVILTGNDELILHGMIIGNVLAKDSSSFTLHGMITGNLIIENNAQVFLHGMVSGNVVSKGGKLIHYGTIGGTLNELGGEIELKENSMINKSKIPIDSE
jgi:hypothetical protein